MAVLYAPAPDSPGHGLYCSAPFQGRLHETAFVASCVLFGSIDSMGGIFALLRILLRAPSIGNVSGTAFSSQRPPVLYLRQLWKVSRRFWYWHADKPAFYLCAAGLRRGKIQQGSAPPDSLAVGHRHNGTRLLSHVAF